MVESQNAGLTASNVKIASVTVGPTPEPSRQTSVGSTITSNPHVMYEFHEVLAERARVASVKLQLILKPPSKKDKNVPVLCEQSGLPVCNQMLPNSYKSLCVF